MPKLNQLQHSIVIKKEFKRQTSTWAIAQKESPKRFRSSPSRLCSGTSITLMITGSSHIYSHQQVNDHCKRKDHTTKHTTINSRV